MLLRIRKRGTPGRMPDVPGKILMNPLALTRSGSTRMTTHQAVVRLVARMERNKKAIVRIRKVGWWNKSELMRRLEIW
jgi:hypothetical protein